MLLYRRVLSKSLCLKSLLDNLWFVSLYCYQWITTSICTVYEREYGSSITTIACFNAYAFRSMIDFELDGVVGLFFIKGDP